jgi:plastocyanin
MRLARPLTLAVLSLTLITGCSTASAGWTYAPAPSVTPAPSSSASASGSAAPSASANGDTVNISASGVKFEQDSVTAPAGKPFQIVFDNKDAGTPHNVTIHQGSATGNVVFDGKVFPGVATMTYDVSALPAGTYAFVCIVHPTAMIGTMTIQ